jgi:hypothetical protein
MYVLFFVYASYSDPPAAFPDGWKIVQGVPSVGICKKFIMGTCVLFYRKRHFPGCPAFHKVALS